jgi:ATP phosphoribosyltransferase
MAQPALDVVAAAGLSFEASDRALMIPCGNAPVDLLLVRADDIPEYVQDGVVDAGITGANLVVETQADVETLVELGFGRCTLEAIVPVGAPQSRLEDLAGLRVATSYPTTTRERLGELGVAVELVTVSGSVEATPRLGLADAIVDLVTTGSTASANGLRRIGKLLDSQAVLIENRSARERKRDLLERLELMLRGVVAARRRRYVMLNAHESQLDAIRSVLPSMGSPTVLHLLEQGQVAVHAAVEADDVWDLLPRLKSAGGSSILVVPVERLVP